MTDQPVPSTTRLAATVVIFRDRPAGPPELLIMERAGTMAFAAGALVFPGGALDPDDLAWADRLGWPMDREEAAARIAAVRETIEESGIAVGFAATPDPAIIADMRQGLIRGEAFSGLVARHGLTIDPDRLVPFARWHPSLNEQVKRVFDTRFYLTRDESGGEAMVDASENVHLFWASAQEVLDMCARGDGQIIFPTKRNLERLALFGSFDAAVAHARDTPIEKVQPWMEERAGETYLCIPSHLGYPVTSEAISALRRG